MTAREISGDFAYCRKYTRRHAKSFSFASYVLPRLKRNAAFAVYAFCRRADNIVDEARDRSDALRELDELRRELDGVYGGAEFDAPGLAALAETVTRYDIPKEYFLELLLGVRMDLERNSYNSFDELRQYCYRVASVVGLIMTRIFGREREEADRYAVDLGIAMQLTNILRDIREDAQMGRLYLPREELAGFGLTEEDIRGGRMDDRFRSFMAFQAERARRLYAEAEKGIGMLANDGSRFCVTLMSRIYRGILDAIEERNYDVFAERAFVPLAGKLRIAAQAFHDTRRGARPGLSVIFEAPETAEFPSLPL